MSKQEITPDNKVFRFRTQVERVWIDRGGRRWTTTHEVVTDSDDFGILLDEENDETRTQIEQVLRRYHAIEVEIAKIGDADARRVYEEEIQEAFAHASDIEAGVVEAERVLVELDEAFAHEERIAHGGEV